MTSTDTTSKPFKIEKRQVYEVYKAVKSNHGAVGVDGQTLEMFERDLAYRATAKLAGRIASSRSVPERAGRCLIRMLPALQCLVKRRAVGMRDCGGW